MASRHTSVLTTPHGRRRRERRPAVMLKTMTATATAPSQQQPAASPAGAELRGASAAAIRGLQATWPTSSCAGCCGGSTKCASSHDVPAICADGSAFPPRRRARTASHQLSSTLRAAPSPQTSANLQWLRGDMNLPKGQAWRRVLSVATALNGGAVNALLGAGAEAFRAVGALVPEGMLRECLADNFEAPLRRAGIMCGACCCAA